MTRCEYLIAYMEKFSSRRWYKDFTNPNPYESGFRVAGMKPEEDAEMTDYCSAWNEYTMISQAPIYGYHYPSSIEWDRWYWKRTGMGPYTPTIDEARARYIVRGQRNLHGSEYEKYVGMSMEEYLSQDEYLG